MSDTIDGYDHDQYMEDTALSNLFWGDVEE